jgi:hypothetical protein
VRALHAAGTCGAAARFASFVESWMEGAGAFMPLKARFSSKDRGLQARLIAAKQQKM